MPNPRSYQNRSFEPVKRSLQCQHKNVFTSHCVCPQSEVHDILVTFHKGDLVEESSTRMLCRAALPKTVPMTHVSPAPETHWAVPHSCAYCGPCSTCPVTNLVTAVTSQFALLPPRATSCSSTFSQQPTACQQAFGIQELPRGQSTPKGVPPPEGSGECLQAQLRGPPPIFKPAG